MYKADESDTATLAETLVRAQAHTVLAGGESEITDVIADKGHHSTANPLQCEAWGIRSYIPERESRGRRKWADKPAEHKQVVHGNRRRVKGKRGKRLGRLRSEYAERSFAHVCETGGPRRSWLHGLEDVTKRYLMYVAGKNLGVIMRELFGVGKPRTLQSEGGGRFSSFWERIAAVVGLFQPFRGHLAHRLGWGATSFWESVAPSDRYIPRRIPSAA